jgi:hypothetical protein
MKALISGDKIVEICDEEFPVNKDLQWVDVAESVTLADTYTDGKVITKPIEAAPQRRITLQDVIDELPADIQKRIAAKVNSKR